MLRSITFAAFALASSAAFAAPRPIVAEKDGYRFEYTAEIQGDQVVIKGRDLNEREKFSFVVEPTGSVHGYYGFTPVRFSVPKARQSALFTSLKAQQPATVASAAVAGALPAAN